MESLLTNFSETHRIFSYLIVFFSMFIEGEIVLLLAGALSHRGYLNPSDLILIAFAGAVLHDIVYWSIGKKLAESQGKKFLFLNLEKIRGFLSKLKIGNGLYIFVSKFAWNFNRIVLVASGYAKMPLKHLLRYSLPACLIWAITLVSLGHIFAYKTHLLKKDLKTAAIFIMLLILVIVVLENLFRRILKKKINQ